MKRIEATLKKLHADQSGMETLQTVMLIAVAAIILLFVKTYWENIQEWFSGLVDQVLDWDA